MSLLGGALGMGRAVAETRMTETVIAGSYTDGHDENLNDIRTITATHYTGIAQIKYPTLTVSDAVAGGQQIATQQIVVKVPTGSPRIPVGDMFRVETSTADGLLVGREFRVEGSPQSGQTTSHRYPVSELS